MRRAAGLAALWLVSLIVFGVRVEAQARPTATGPGTSVRIGGGISLFQTDYGQTVLGGTHTWVDLNPTWRYGVEVEGRWLRYHEDPDGAHQSTYLIGPRLVILPGKIQPYVKAMAGAGMFSYPFGYGKGTYFVASGAVGVDLRLGRGLHIRALEVEAQDWPQFTFGKLHPYGVSAGISYTIFRGSTLPHGLGR